MPDAVTQRYLDERASLVGRIEGIKTTSIEQNRDLSEQDRKALGDYSVRIKELDGMIDLAANSYEMDVNVAQRIANMGIGTDYAPVNYRSAGELLFDVLHMQEPESRRRYETTVKRAAQHMGTSAANTVAVAGGMGGLVVSPVYGPVIDIMPQGRPFLTMLGVRQAPSSLSFIRPRIVDPNIATGVGVQALEKQELASQKFDIATDPLTLSTVGGYLNVSQQLISLVASSLDIILGQLNRRLALASEKLGIAEVAKTTAKVTLAAGADAAALRKAIYDAAVLVYTNTGALPTWLVMGPQGWARLGGAVDLAGRPLFPNVGPVNADGSMSANTFTIAGLGFPATVTPAITDTTMYVGNDVGIEAYEYRYPVLEAVEPSLLGRQIAVASSLVFYRPPSAEAGPSNTPPAKYEGVVKIAP
jgi:hypothetical protein